MPCSDDEDVAMLQRNRRIHRQVREPVYAVWVQHNIGRDIHKIFAELPQNMDLMSKINDDEEPAVNEIEPEQEAAIDAIEENR